MHLMIDLETMGTRPDAPIVSIGAVLFNSVGLGREFYVNVDLASSVRDGGATIDPATVMWWMRQDNAAREALTDGGGKEIRTALYNFRDWLKPDEVTGVWGNGATFDNVILSETHRRLGLAQPWPFWVDRCYRTVKNLYPDVPLERSGTHHNALDDAKTQALHLIEISKKHGGLL